MKNIFPFFLIILFCLSFFFCVENDDSFINIAQKYNAQISFYASSPQEVEGASCIPNGSASIISCNSQNAKKIYSQLEGIVGMSFCTKGDRKILLHIFDDLRLQVKSKDKIGEITTYLAYTNLFPNNIVLDNKKINVQIAVNGANIVVGTPIILGSY